jgi:hypothetical protein
MIPTTDPSKRTESERLAADVAAFLSSGGEIKRLGPGEFGFDALTNKQRINPTVINKERRAKALQEGKGQVEPRPRRSRKPAKLPTPKAPRPPREPGDRVDARVRTAEMRRAAKGKPMGKAPVKSDAIVNLLRAKGPMNCRSVATTLVEPVTAVGQLLWVLRKRGRVESLGRRGNMRWKAKA